MYRLINRQLSLNASRLVALREETKKTELESHRRDGFFGVSTALMRSLPKLYIDFFVSKKSLTLVGSHLVEALRENGNFIAALLTWIGVEENKASDRRDEILACRNITYIEFISVEQGSEVIVMWESDGGVSHNTKSTVGAVLPFVFEPSQCETTFNFALDNPFVIFAAVLKAAEQKTTINIVLPIWLQSKFVEETFYRTFFWMFNAAARLTQWSPGIHDGMNLGSFNIKYTDFPISRTLSMLAAKSPNSVIALTFGNKRASCRVNSYFQLYEIEKGNCELTGKTINQLIDDFENKALGLGTPNFVIIRNPDEAAKFDKRVLAFAPEAVSHAENISLNMLGFPLVIVTDELTKFEKDSGLFIRNYDFYDVKTGTEIGHARIKFGGPEKDAEGVTRLDVSKSSWLSEPMNDLSQNAFERIVLTFKRINKKFIISHKDGSPFTIHDDFLMILTRAMQKGKPTRPLLDNLKTITRQKLSYRSLKSVTIDMTANQPIEAMEVTYA